MFAAMPERCNWPQVFRVKITFELLLTICFVSTTTNSMKCLVNWIPLTSTVRLERSFFFGSNPTSRWGWVFVERTRILNGIQFTTHFIEFLVLETKRFVVSSVNVILTRQTCGQRSGMAAESKRGR